MSTFRFVNDEVRILEFGLQILTRCPPEEITEKMILQQVKNKNLGFGDRLIIQTCNHERTIINSFCEYLVEREDYIAELEDTHGNPTRVPSTRWNIIMTTPWSDSIRGWDKYTVPKAKPKKAA